MKIVQAVPGTFHHFDIANQLNARGALEQVFSTFPWFRLKREGLPRNKVQTRWLLATATEAWARSRMAPPRRVLQELWLHDHASFDRWVSRRVPECDVFFALSGVGIRAGRRVQQRGGTYVCDRGSAHIAYQDRLLREEYARWGVAADLVHPESIRREEAEYQQADAITVPSSFALRSFVEMGVPREKLLRIPYGVRLDRFYPDGEPEPGSFDILFAGQVSFRKGVPYLLEAFRQFRHLRKRLRLAGWVPDDMRKFLATQDLAGVEVLGAVTQPELRRLMSTSRCLVLPSIEEGLALVQGQALACGCPVIATTNTGGEDLFTGSAEGFILPIRSPAAIAEKLQWLADSPDAAQAMRGAALRKVTGIGGWSEYADTFLQAMGRLLARR